MPRLLLNCVVLLLVVGLVGGCAGRFQPPSPTGGSTASKAEKARSQAESLALNVVTGAANAQVNAIPELSQSRKGKSEGFLIIAPTPPGVGNPFPPTPPRPWYPGMPPPAAPSAPQVASARGGMPSTTPPRPGSPAVIKERVSSSTPFPTEAEAEEEALANASAALERRLAQLDPAVYYRPAVNEVRNEFVRKDSRTVRLPTEAETKEYEKFGLTKLVYVEYDVEVTADQVRDLRARGRIFLALRVLGGLSFVALAGFLFLRLDDWTKGYLTHWLACAAVVLVGGAAAALYFV